MTSDLPVERLRVLVDAPPRRAGRQVVYRMTANRRLAHNPAHVFAQRVPDHDRYSSLPV